MAADFPESRVLRMWQKCQGRADLETEQDGPVSVIYPGRANDGGGADFRDAVVRTTRGLITGDVEIHTRASDWRAHRHHLDPLYNRVVLHVVFRYDINRPVKLQNGRTVPTLALCRLFTPAGKYNRPEIPPVPCRRSGGGRYTGTLLEVLDIAGEQRFQSRVATFQAVSSPTEGGQALYRGIMAALGYTKNKHPMIELACRLPLRRLESFVTAETPDKEALAGCQAMLLGKAGLLPSQRARPLPDNGNDPWVNRLEREWAETGEEAALSEADWRFAGVRPDNHPDRRLAAMGRLLLRYRRDGLLNGLMDLVEKLPAEAGHRPLEEALIIKPGDDPDGYTSPGAPLGQGRAAVIAINVLLPFALAWGRLNSHRELAEKAPGLYLCYPAQAMNTIERHMCRQFDLDENLVDTARRQQGLLHIFKTWCTLGKCPDCPVNKPAVKGIRPARSGYVSAGSR